MAVGETVIVGVATGSSVGVQAIRNAKITESVIMILRVNAISS